jgi:hypothetical protein
VEIFSDFHQRAFVQRTHTASYRFVDGADCTSIPCLSKVATSDLLPQQPELRSGARERADSSEPRSVTSTAEFCDSRGHITRLQLSHCSDSSSRYLLKLAACCSEGFPTRFVQERHTFAAISENSPKGHRLQEKRFGLLLPSTRCD